MSLNLRSQKSAIIESLITFNMHLETQNPKLFYLYLTVLSLSQQILIFSLCKKKETLPFSTFFRSYKNRYQLKIISVQMLTHQPMILTTTLLRLTHKYHGSEIPIWVVNRVLKVCMVTSEYHLGSPFNTQKNVRMWYYHK